MSKVTKLNPRESAGEPKGYTGSIRGTALAEAIEENCQDILSASAILGVVAEAIDSYRSMSGYPRALAYVAEILDKVAGNLLNTQALEDRAIEIAQAREAEAAGGAA